MMRDIRKQLQKRLDDVKFRQDCIRRQLTVLAKREENLTHLLEIEETSPEEVPSDKG